MDTKADKGGLNLDDFMLGEKTEFDCAHAKTTKSQQPSSQAFHHQYHAVTAMKAEMSGFKIPSTL